MSIIYANYAENDITNYLVKWLNSVCISNDSLANRSSSLFRSLKRTLLDDNSSEYDFLE